MAKDSFLSESVKNAANLGVIDKRVLCVTLRRLDASLSGCFAVGTLRCRDASLSGRFAVVMMIKDFRTAKEGSRTVLFYRMSGQQRVKTLRKYPRAERLAPRASEGVKGRKVEVLQSTFFNFK